MACRFDPRRGVSVRRRNGVLQNCPGEASLKISKPADVFVAQRENGRHNWGTVPVAPEEVVIEHAARSTPGFAWANGRRFECGRVHGNPLSVAEPVPRALAAPELLLTRDDLFREGFVAAVIAENEGAGNHQLKRGFNFPVLSRMPVEARKRMALSLEAAIARPSLRICRTSALISRGLPVAGLVIVALIAYVDLLLSLNYSVLLIACKLLSQRPRCATEVRQGGDGATPVRSFAPSIGASLQEGAERNARPANRRRQTTCQCFGYLPFSESNAQQESTLGYAMRLSGRSPAALKASSLPASHPLATFCHGLAATPSKHLARAATRYSRSDPSLSRLG